MNPSFILILALCLPPWGVMGEPLQNRMGGQASPYLALHGADPVHWQPWEPAVLERAQATNRPIFISSGYFACHWCHVMQRESFQDPAIAALLNRHFIPVKADRELNPALDDRLTAFAQETRGSAGWPLNAFLTPEGHAFMAHTYLPPQAFGDWIRKVAAVWAQKDAALRTLAREAAEALDRPPPGIEPLNLSPAGLRLRFTQGVLAQADELAGGFGEQGRFPMAPQWLAVLAVQRTHPKPVLAQRLALTLDQMAQQGLHDHLAGGFFRYTVDPAWTTPHFEKMLYNQALQALLYLRAAAVLERPAYREIARRTLAFTIQAMRHEDGGYVASLSAIDTADQEGGGYLWTPEAVKAALPPEEAALALEYWSLQGPPLLDGGRLPIPATPNEGAEQIPPATLERVRAKLLAQRPAHPRDHKRILAWNGLLLRAFAEALAPFPAFEAPGAELATALSAAFNAAEGLPRTLGGEVRGTLADYAFAADGLWQWAQATQSPAHRSRALAIARAGWERFWDGAAWTLAAAEATLPGGQKVAVEDGPMPSPAAVLIRLGLASEDAALEQKARQALEKARPLAEREPFWYPGYLQLLLP